MRGGRTVVVSHGFASQRHVLACKHQPYIQCALNFCMQDSYEIWLGPLGPGKVLEAKHISNPDFATSYFDQTGGGVQVR